MPAPKPARWQVRRGFSGEKIVADKADEAAGLAPSNEDNAVSGNFNLEKPYCPLSIDGRVIGGNKDLHMAKHFPGCKNIHPLLKIGGDRKSVV